MVEEIGFGNIFGYVNNVLDDGGFGKFENTITAALKDDKVTVEQMYKYTDMIKAGIVDPSKVTRSALENAASVASMLLTTEAAVIDIPEDKPAAPAMPAGMGGMGGMM